MRNTGMRVLLATFGLVGLLIILWQAAFIFGVGGNLIHLSLVLAMLIAPIGGIGGIVLLIIASARRNPQQ
ncbi:MAG: hypothetical protein ABR568_12895 [Pyrinomonadaceae bacterium]